MKKSLAAVGLVAWSLATIVSASEPTPKPPPPVKCELKGEPIYDPKTEDVIIGFIDPKTNDIRFCNGRKPIRSAEIKTVSAKELERAKNDRSTWPGPAQVLPENPDGSKLGGSFIDSVGCVGGCAGSGWVTKQGGQRCEGFCFPVGQCACHCQTSCTDVSTGKQ